MMIADTTITINTTTRSVLKHNVLSRMQQYLNIVHCHCHRRLHHQII